jgi:hypothetical protein
MGRDQRNPPLSLHSTNLFHREIFHVSQSEDPKEADAVTFSDPWYIILCNFPDLSFTKRVSDEFSGLANNAW